MATSMPSASIPFSWALRHQPRCMFAPMSPTRIFSSTIDVSSGGVLQRDADEHRAENLPSGLQRSGRRGRHAMVLQVVHASA
jgi:hypothetical protein